MLPPSIKSRFDVILLLLGNKNSTLRSLQEKGKFITSILSLSHKDTKELKFLCMNSSVANNSAKIRSKFVTLQLRMNMLLTYTSESWDYNYSELLTQLVPALLAKFSCNNFSKDAVEKHLADYAKGQPKVLLLYTRLLIIKDILEVLYEEIVKDRNEELIKEINFPPEYKQAGISLLSYFSVVLEKTLPDMDIPVSIKQSKDKVIMILSLPEGSKEKVVELLSSYGKVIKGEMKPEDILKNQNDIIALKYKKDMAEMEARHTRELLYSERAQTKQRIEFLETEVGNLYRLMSDSLSSAQNITNNLLSTLQANQANDSKRSAMLVNALTRTAEQNDESAAKEILVTLRNEEPSIYAHFKELIIKGSISGVSGNYLYDWLKALIITLPK